MPSRPQKLRNMVNACRGLETADDSVFPRSVRIQIPRMLIALNEIRNNRGAGHVGGDVNPNEMDSRVVLEMSKWIMAELVRMFHNVTTEEASTVVESLVERTIPVVWVTDGRSRVLKLGCGKRMRFCYCCTQLPAPSRSRLYSNGLSIPIRLFFETRFSDVYIKIV